MSSYKLTQKDWDARWHSAGDWCAKRLPDLIDPATGSACSFAVASALRLKRELEREPLPGEVRSHRESWLGRLDVPDPCVPEGF